MYAPPPAPPAPAQSSGKAIWSLILGIASFFFLPLIGSILAVILGNGAKKDIAANPYLTGLGMAKAGVILGWINIALAGAGVCVGLIIVIITLVSGAAIFGSVASGMY